MKMFRFLQLTITGLCFVVGSFSISGFSISGFSNNALAQDEAGINTIKVRDNLYMLVGQGGNIGVFIGADGTFLIDDQYAPMTEKILAAVRALGGDIPRFLINTHFHGDHTGGNENFGKAGATIYAHDHVRERMSRESVSKTFNSVTPPQPAAALPLVTFAQDLNFHINNDHIRVIHAANAHTDGDSIIVFTQANVIHTGDLFFNGFYPFIDVERGGSLAGMITAAERIVALSDANTKIIPGHGPLTDRNGIIAYRSMLLEVNRQLGALRREGKSVTQALAAKPLKKLDAEWGGGFLNTDRFIEIIYHSIPADD